MVDDMHDGHHLTPADVTSALEGVAPRLRQARQDARLTLADVATSTGIGVSTLSRLESGRRRPALDLLLPLARLYRVPLDDLVGAPETGDPRIHPRPVRRHGRIYIPLSRHGFGVQCVKIILPPKPVSERVRLRKHEGYEWVYVLSGQLALHVGKRVTLLNQGEAAEFDTRTPHAMTNAGAEETELLALFSPQGERIHVGPIEQNGS